MANRTYTRHEVEAILRRSLERTGPSDEEPGTSHAELEAAAREAGVPPDVLQRAAEEVMAGREAAAELRAVRNRAWRGFAAHLIPYVMVNMLLAFVNLMSGGAPWMLVIALGWGIGLAVHLIRVAYPHPDRLERQLQRHRFRMRRKEAARRIATGARRLESAAQHRVARWLEGAAERMHEAPEQTGRFRVPARPTPRPDRPEGAEVEQQMPSERDRTKRSG